MEESEGDTRSERQMIQTTSPIISRNAIILTLSADNGERMAISTRHINQPYLQSISSRKIQETYPQIDQDGPSGGNPCHCFALYYSNWRIQRRKSCNFIMSSRRLHNQPNSKVAIPVRRGSIRRLSIGKRLKNQKLFKSALLYWQCLRSNSIISTSSYLIRT